MLREGKKGERRVDPGDATSGWTAQRRVSGALFKIFSCDMAVNGYSFENHPEYKYEFLLQVSLD